MIESIRNKIELVKGDITRIPVDAIVNAANSSLYVGGGVDGAINRAGGSIIQEECAVIRKKQGGCSTGDAVFTSAGNLPAKFVIHTVGPIWRGGKDSEAELLANCYENSLMLAVKNNCKTVSFPNVSTGVYGFPKEKAARIAVDAVVKFLMGDESIDKVIFVCFDDENYRYISKCLK